MSFDSGPKRIEVGHGIAMAHNLLLRVLDSQNAHFKLGLDKILQGNLADFQNAYASGKSTD